MGPFISHNIDSMIFFTDRCTHSFLFTRDSVDFQSMGSLFASGS